MKKLLIVEPLMSESMKLLDDRPDIAWELVEDASPESLKGPISDADAITVRIAPLTPEILDAAKSLRAISRHGVGYDNIPVDYCTNRRIAVTVVGDANSSSVAEHAMYLMLAASRAGVEIDEAVRGGRFADRSKLIGRDLRGRTLLIVGYGRIGRRLARLAEAFGLRIVVFDPYVEELEGHAGELVPSLDDGLKIADILSLHVPLNADTENLIGERELGLLREESIVVNASRGGLIDENALLAAIRSGHTRGAGLDVFESEPLPADSPLVHEKRIILSPHSASLTRECLEAMGRVTLQNAIDAIDGNLNPKFVVNPEALDPSSSF
ncbi:MAG: hydroxyacid dehydrogenase [Albidovulum sp.]|nr:hydroxyacid dehydrogenase [Albidovulum sp.]